MQHTKAVAGRRKNYQVGRPGAKKVSKTGSTDDAILRDNGCYGC